MYILVYADVYVDLRAMNQFVYITLLVALLNGALILFLLTMRVDDGRLTKARPATVYELTECANTNHRHRYSTTDEMRYILYGIGSQFSPNDQQIVDYISRHILQPSTKRPRRLRSRRVDVSQHGQSAFVDKLLSRRRNGFFVECGAYDGETISNSLFFEQHRNWTGLLIEADPVYYHALLEKNRRAYVLLACLSDKPRPSVLRMLRTVVGHSRIIDNTNQSHHDAAHTVFEVNCFPLNSIMAALGVSRVDYLSLDVEGPELKILQTVDWSRLRIDVITIEYRVSGNKLATLKKLNDLRQFFRGTGVYREEAVLPKGSEADGLDIVFSRID